MPAPPEAHTRVPAMHIGSSFVRRSGTKGLERRIWDISPTCRFKHRFGNFDNEKQQVSKFDGSPSPELHVLRFLGERTIL
ncbi:hypothetical protein BRADI_5g08092v3 [Brachypodium distachyon]|uniref:Uncharacterized protein n=1 Tax=Brachypodium distachyon TaxID=15368 RepID=A0A2K2CFW2_BRADI|nr:hypothetical protein BRADI_5g08092v3 [Brachypodium distachyon]